MTGVCVVAEADGVVLSSESNKIVIREKDGKAREYKLTKFSRSNQSNCYNQRPIVFKGDEVKAGDVIEIREKSKSLQRYKDIVEVTGGRLVPEWLESDIENLKGTVKELPTREAIDVPVDEMMIVELYSK